MAASPDGYDTKKGLWAGIITAVWSNVLNYVIVSGLITDCNGPNCDFLLFDHLG